MGPGYRYSTPPSHPSSHYPGYTLPAPYRTLHLSTARHTLLHMVVGLRSVDRLSLSAEISGFGTMTEVYNVVRIDNPNDHKSILQNK